jgi:hypothetical protein
MRPLATLLLFALAPAAAAHDFWIQPSTFRPAPGERVALSLFVGEGDEREERPRQDDHFARFVWAAPPEPESDEPRPVLGVAGVAPAGYLRIEREGLHAVIYESRGSLIELEAERFESYLREEGLERIVEERARLGESLAPGRERYVRCAKALLCTPGSATAGFDRRFELPVELVPLGDPWSRDAGAPLRLLALRAGRPLPGLRIEAHRLARPAGSAGAADAPVAAVSDAEGRLELRLPAGARGAGAWLFAGVHMERAPEGSGVDWVSWWPSLTLDLSREVEKDGASSTPSEPPDPGGGGGDAAERRDGTGVALSTGSGAGVTR